jgi:RNA polymerase sigma-70 factor (ECF subfamily)
MNAPVAPLGPALLAALPEASRRELAGGQGLDELLAGHLASAHVAWPELAQRDEDFVAYLAARLPERNTREALEGVHAADLWLAAACARGMPGSANAFEGRYMPQLDGVLSRAGAELRDELRQRLREKLLVSPAGKAPRIAEYGGRGPLTGWLKVVASRIALDFLRAREPASPDGDELLSLPASGADPELAHLRDRYRQEFKVAMHEAAAALGTRPRNVLRLHYIDGLTMDEIAALHRVHRLTVVRWVTEAREALASTTRRVLLQRFGIGRKELDSILGLMQSQFDLSIRALLRTSSGQPAAPDKDAASRQPSQGVRRQ